MKVCQVELKEILLNIITAEYPSTNLHKNSVYCILTRSSKNAAKSKQ